MSKNIEIHAAMTWSAKKCFIDLNGRLQDWFSKNYRTKSLYEWTDLPGNQVDTALPVWTQQYMKTDSTHNQKVNFLICFLKKYDFLGLAFASNQMYTTDICCHCWQQRLKCFPVFRNINKWFCILLFDIRDDLLILLILLFLTCLLVERPVITKGVLINHKYNVINRDNLHSRRFKAALHSLAGS